MKDNRCVVCGLAIPEGMMVCPICEKYNTDTKNSIMIETVVNIDTIDKVKEFCNLCSKCTGLT